MTRAPALEPVFPWVFYAVNKADLTSWSEAMKSEENRDRNKSGKQGGNRDQDRKQSDQGSPRPGNTTERDRERKGNRENEGNR
jgi:hypothetical protein